MKKNIVFGIILLVIAIVGIIIKSNAKYIEGRVVDINGNKSLLIHINNEPFVVGFNSKFNNIQLNDIVKIKTDGIVRESYPAQMNGLSIKRIKNEYKRITEPVTSILFDTTYYEEELTYKSKFKTLMLKDKFEIDDYVRKSNIILQEKIDDNHIAIVSSTSMSSSGVISFEGLYQNKKNISINLNITTGEDVTNDIVTRGVLLLINKKYIDYDFETVSNIIIKNEY